MEILKQLIANLGADPYEVLETAPDADFSQLRKNYRTLAFKYHPDKNKQQSAKQMFLKINQAFEFLESQANRFVYKNHIKAIEERKKREASMDSERRRMAEDLKRREQEYEQRQRDMEKQLKRRKQFFEKKMREEEQRENIKNQIYEGMGTQKYYEDVSSFEVEWESGFSFTKEMLQMAFEEYGTIKKIAVQAKRNKAKITFLSIEDCTRLVSSWSHPLMTVQFYLQKEEREHLLGALKRQKVEKVDLSLNSDTISRLKQIMNRSSTLYKGDYI